MSWKSPKLPLKNKTKTESDWHRFKFEFKTSGPTQKTFQALNSQVKLDLNCGFNSLKWRQLVYGLRVVGVNSASHPQQECCPLTVLPLAGKRMFISNHIYLCTMRVGKPTRYHICIDEASSIYMPQPPHHLPQHILSSLQSNKKSAAYQCHP